jgi:hypothetical protein
MLVQLYRISVVLEILLFPWINSGLGIEVIFYLLLVINICIGAYFMWAKNHKLLYIDLLVTVFILAFLLNPSSYWESLGLTAVYIRVPVFLLRYVFLVSFSFSRVLPIFSLGVLVSSVMALYLWSLGMGDQWRLNYPYGDPNMQGFIFGTYALIILIERKEKGWRKMISTIAVISSLAIVLLGASRGSTLSLAIVSFCYLLLRMSWKSRFVAACSITLLVYGVQRSDYLKQYVIIERIISPRKSDTGAAESRFAEVDAATKDFQKNPLNLAFGFGLSRSAAKEQDSFESRFRIHNTPVAVLYDGGIVALVIAGILYAQLWKKTIRKNVFFLLLFISLNSLTFYALSFYHFFICLRYLRDSE